MRRVYLKGPSWTALYLPGLGFQMLSTTYVPLPKPALRWIGKLRARSKRFSITVSIPEDVKARGILIPYQGEVLEIDLGNAYLCTARSWGLVSYKMWVEALQIRKRYNIKPAELLGKALGGWTVKEVTEEGKVIESTYLIQKKDHFRHLAYATYQITRDVAKATEAIAYNVDALIFPYERNVDELLSIVRKEYANRFALSEYYISLKVSHKRAIFLVRGASFHLILADALTGEKKLWAVNSARSI